MLFKASHSVIDISFGFECSRWSQHVFETEGSHVFSKSRFNYS